MKRVTISMSDSSHEKIESYAKLNDLSFSKACANLATTSINTLTADDLAQSIVTTLRLHKICWYIAGNYDVPVSVIQRAISHIISRNDEGNPLVEFAEIVSSCRS